jgi:hypothetical protein
MTEQDPITSANNSTWTYGYDSQNRLTSANKAINTGNGAAEQRAITYDANGNMTKKAYSGNSDFIAT